MHPVDQITLNIYEKGVKSLWNFHTVGGNLRDASKIYLGAPKRHFNTFYVFLVKLTPEELENLNLWRESLKIEMIRITWFNFYEE